MIKCDLLYVNMMFVVRTYISGRRIHCMHVVFIMNRPICTAQILACQPAFIMKRQAIDVL